MKKPVIIFVMILLFLFLFGCTEAGNASRLTLPEGESLPEGMTITDEQLSLYYEMKRSDQEGNKIKNFEDIHDDLMLLVALGNEYRNDLDQARYPMFGVNPYSDLTLSSGFAGEIPLDDREQSALTRVVGAFYATPYDLEIMVMYPGRVSFDTDNRLYALVYTEDDSEPQYMTWPDEDRRILVEKIQPHWYHVFAD